MLTRPLCSYPNAAFLLLLLFLFKGRTFDGHMLDMIELGIVGYKGLEELAGLAKRVGSKPAFVFAGEKWGREEAYRKMQNIFLGEILSIIGNTGASALCRLYLVYYKYGCSRFMVRGRVGSHRARFSIASRFLAVQSKPS